MHDPADLLRGAREIATHLGWPVRRVQRLATAGALPVFKIGGALHATRSGLLAFLTARQRAATRRAKAIGSAPLAS